MGRKKANRWAKPYFEREWTPLDRDGLNKNATCPHQKTGGVTGLAKKKKKGNGGVEDKTHHPSKGPEKLGGESRE